MSEPPPCCAVFACALLACGRLGRCHPACHGSSVAGRSAPLWPLPRRPLPASATEARRPVLRAVCLLALPPPPRAPRYHPLQPTASASWLLFPPVPRFGSGSSGPPAVLPSCLALILPRYPLRASAAGAAVADDSLPLYLPRHHPLRFPRLCPRSCTRACCAHRCRLVTAVGLARGLRRPAHRWFPAPTAPRRPSPFALWALRSAPPLSTLPFRLRRPPPPRSPMFIRRALTR